ncbi:MAG: DNA-processing protein DprA [Gracilibacteraceae bacterium]|jgi:DNA processing protein|nr:DNA-processing protein DprA [Gracilibacteraceae bacterium]
MSVSADAIFDHEKEKLLRACFLTLPQIGSGHLRQILGIWGGAAAAYQQAPRAAGKLSGWLSDFARQCGAADPVRMAETLAREGIGVVVPEEREYPCLLKECPDAPPLLFYKGQLSGGQEGIAIVGARKATHYGKAAAGRLAGEIAGAGFVIVSGLARGIDGAAHEGALRAGGITWAFMAGGLERVYPGEHRALAVRIAAGGGALLSEFPPGASWLPQRFPMRNRLISGVSRGVVVVEAGERSGSLITADFALEQGRDVFAVPGPIFSEVSLGAHHLLRSGALLAASGADVLGEYEKPAGEKQAVSPPVPAAGTRVSAAHREILACLSDVPLHVDELRRQCRQTAPETALSLLELELSGRIRSLPGQHFVLSRDSA